jgi:hypothetical protein
MERHGDLAKSLAILGQPYMKSKIAEQREVETSARGLE